MAWDRDLVLAQKKIISEMYKRTKDIDLEDCILYLKEILDFDNIKFLSKFSKKENIKTLCMFEDFLPEIEIALLHDSLYANTISDCLSTKSIAIEELLSFSNDFFKILDKEFYNVFLEVYKHRHYNFQKSNNMSCTYTIGKSGFSYFSYINIQSSDTIDEYFSATHEYGHAIHDKILYRALETDNYPFHELLSYFCEYLSLFYYERLHPEDLKDIIIYKDDRLYTFLTYIKRIIYYHRALEYKNCTRFGMINNIKRANSLSSYEARETLNDDMYYNFIYSISFLTLIELLYTGDLEKSIYIVKKLIKLPKTSDYVSVLAANGINLCEHLSDFIKYTEKNHDSKILQI